MKKSFFVGLTVAAIVLLIFSLVAVTEVISANPKDIAVNLEPQAALFLPKRSPLVASFLINPDRLTLAAKLATKPGDRRNFNREIINLRTQLYQTWGLDYERDLQPWLGAEVTLAITNTDLDRDPKNGLQAGYLIALESSQPDLAQKHLERFWQKQGKAGVDLAFEQYQGVSIISADGTNVRKTIQSEEQFKEQTEGAIANAKIGKFVLFANHPSVLRNAINNLQVPNLALARSVDYQNSLNHLKQSTSLGFALTYINPTEIQILALAPYKADSLLKNLMIGFKSHDLGIKAETTLALPSTSELTNTTSADTEILKYINAGSSLVVGNNLAQTFNIIDKLSPQLQQTIAIKQILKQSLDLTPESFNWITDRFAIAIPTANLTEADSANTDKTVNNSKNKPNNPSDAPNWLLIAKNKDPEQVKSAFAQLDRDAQTRSKFTVGEVIRGDRSLTLWTKLDVDSSRNITGKVALVHTDIESDSEYIFISNSVSTIESALAGTSILETDSVFKAIATNIGSQNGLIYINSRDLQYLLSQISPSNPLSLLQSLRSMAIGNTKIITTPDTTFLDGQAILNWRETKS